LLLRKFFLCHDSLMAGEISQFAAQLRIRGLVPWVDKHGGFSVGDDARHEARRAILEDCSGFLFYATPAAFNSTFISRVEIPSAIEAKRLDPSFTLFAVPRRLTFDQLKVLSQRHFGEDLSIYHGSPIPRGAATPHLKRAANELLHRALSGVPALGSLSMQFSTRDLLPDSPEDLLRIDGTSLFADNPARPGAWENVIEGLADCKNIIATRFGRPRICVHGSKHITAAFIFGRIFSRFPVDVVQAPGSVWHGDAALGQPAFDVRYRRGAPDSADLILEIATAGKDPTLGVDALLNNDYGPKPHRLSLSPRSRVSKLDKNGCRAAVEQIYSEFEKVTRRVSITTVQLFAAAPQTLMLQLGQRLQGAPAVKLYEWFEGRYVLSVLVPPGVL
jgi:SMODS-associated and fused to various effectors sensor domain